MSQIETNKYLDTSRKVSSSDCFFTTALTLPLAFSIAALSLLQLGIGVDSGADLIPDDAMLGNGAVIVEGTVVVLLTSRA